MSLVLSRSEWAWSEAVLAFIRLSRVTWWRVKRLRRNARLLFQRKYVLPLVVLGGVLTIGLPQIVGPMVKQRYRVALDLQKDGCLPYTAYVFRMGSVDSRAPTGMRVTLERGMFVSFIPHDGMMGGVTAFDGHRVVKMVAGLPGDVLEVRNDVAYINGQRWDQLWLREELKREAGAFDRREVVPDGKVLLMGTLKGSFDGRYYGFVAQEEINAQAYPIF